MLFFLIDHVLINMSPKTQPQQVYSSDISDILKSGVYLRQLWTTTSFMLTHTKRAYEKAEVPFNFAGEFQEYVDRLAALVTFGVPPIPNPLGLYEKVRDQFVDLYVKSNTYLKDTTGKSIEETLTN